MQSTPEVTKMVMARNRTLVTTKGHVIRFEKDQPISVPNIILEEALAAGANPVNPEDLPKGYLDDDGVPIKREMPKADREAKIIQAMKAIVTDGQRGDFTAGGVPHINAIARITGFQVVARERDELWQKMMDEAASRD